MSFNEQKEGNYLHFARKLEADSGIASKDKRIELKLLRRTGAGEKFRRGHCVHNARVAAI